MSARDRAIAASGMRGVSTGMASGDRNAEVQNIRSNDRDDTVSIDQIASIANDIRQAERENDARMRSAAVGGMLPALPQYSVSDLHTIRGNARSYGSIPFIGDFLNSQRMRSADTLMRMGGARMQDGLLTAPILGYDPKRYGAFGQEPQLTQNRFGVVTYIGMQIKGYEGEFANLVRPAPPELKDDVVAPVVNPVTNQQQCPDGYEFDANLNACRKITPTEFAPVSVSPVPDGRYARMGLLDQPPTGLLEAGFGSPADFAGANMAFRRQSAPMSSYFTDPRSYEGYTLI